jgi:hypothetical protein
MTPEGTDLLFKDLCARLKSNENSWKKLSIHCKKGIQWAIDNGLTQVRINYNNINYGYFYRDIRIL